jgi:hypothetical protein
MTTSRQDKACGVCGFDAAWIGPCEEMRPCPRHADKKCGVCGIAATRECDHAGQFVCGYPLCDDCEGVDGDASKGLGWGFMGHKHVRKERSAPAEGACK